MANETITCGEWLGISNEDYHNRCAYVSASSLKVFAENPARYHGLYIARTIDKPKPTAAMQLGTLVHSLVLEPGRRYAVAPECDKRTKAGRELWNAFILTVEDGREIVDAEQFGQAQKIAAAVLAHDEASQLLSLESPWPNEHAIWWRDEETGILCKSMADKRTPGVLVDLKTTSDASPRGFASTADRFGYAQQAQFYSQGHYDFCGERCSFLFIAVETTAPFTVAIYELDESWIENARDRNATALADLARRLESNDWLPAYSNGVNTLQMPRYAAYSSEYQ